MESKWISVKDRLPNEEGNYLVVIKGFLPFSTAYDKRKGWFDEDIERSKLFEKWNNDVTHWMPLPDATNL